MPDWVRPLDVHFDHHAAEAALDAIAAMRFTLEWAWAAEDRSAGAALARWEGVAADAFGSSHGSRRAMTEDLAARLRVLRAAIEHAVDDAVAQQSRVDALQAEWDAQLRLERRLESEAAAAAERESAAPSGARSTVPGGVR